MGPEEKERLNLKVSLEEILAKQYAWRPWKKIYPLLGNLSGQLILDLGCGIGDQTKDFAQLQAEVIGVDLNPSFIEFARARNIPKARFICSDLKKSTFDSHIADGVWLSFTVSYFPQIGKALDIWLRYLRRGGWLGITEVDDLFAHEPLEPRYRKLVEKYYSQSLREGLYNFCSEENLKRELARRKWHIELHEEFNDLELSFEGPADETVLEAWQTRIEFMMPRFMDRFKDEAWGFREAFLDCLRSKSHRSQARVWFILARCP